MSKLADLLAKAKGFLTQTKEEAATDAVKHDSYDQQLFEELLEEAPALRESLEKLDQDVNYAEDLLRDTLMQFWKGDPEVRDKKEMADSHLINHGVAEDVERSDELRDARRFTQHDKYGSAMATIGASERVHEYAREHGKALEEAEERRKEAEQQEQEKREALEQAAEGAEDNPFADPDMHGPPSPEQQAAMDALAQAMAEAQAAAGESQQASQQAQEQAQQAQAKMQGPINQAVSEAKDDLEEESKLFNGWGIGDGELQEMDFEERARLAQSLKSSRMSQYIELIGRFKMMAAAQRVKKVEYGRDQVVGVELSGDLSRVTMSEISALAMGDDDLAELMELDFYRRLMEEQLLSRKFEGTEKVGKGAIICLVDSSGSMQGEREAWSKAMALAMLDVAKRQKRTFVGINFSGPNQIGVHRFDKGQVSTPGLLAFAEEFFGGGTNFEKPLDRATNILEEEFNDAGKEKGDMVFITDDVCRVSPQWMDAYLKRKERLGFRVFGIAAGVEDPDGTLRAISDNVRGITDFMDTDAVRDIFQIV